jgi:exodeoxyribonuclease VII large subunit
MFDLFGKIEVKKGDYSVTKPLAKIEKNTKQAELKQSEKREIKFIPSVLGFDEFLEPNLPIKTLISQLNWILTQNKVEYLDLALELNKHKSVALKRKLAEVVGKLADKNQLEIIKLWQKTESDRKTWLALETAIDRIERRILEYGTQINLEKGQKVITVSEALTLVKKLLGEKIYIIEGELSDLKLYYNFFYFALKDNLQTRLDCRLLTIRASNLGFVLNEGLNLRLIGKFTISKFSKLTFEVLKIELSGQGELLRNLQMLEKKLQTEGLFEPSRKRKPTLFPLSVLLLASPHSAAKDDFIKVFRARNKSAKIYFLPIKTQGFDAEFLTLSALQKVSEFVDKYDIQTIVITRGGGSQDDLQLFNSERVVRAIYALQRPTIVAIGHERDFTLAEKVADLRASTPSNSAELCTATASEVKFKVVYCFDKIKVLVDNKINKFEQLLSQKYSRSIVLIKNKLTDVVNILQKVVKAENKILIFIRSYIENLYNRKKWQLNQKINQIFINNNKLEVKYQLILKKISTYSSFINNSSISVYSSIKLKIFTKTANIEQKAITLYEAIYLTSPSKIIDKGFAIISQNGKRCRKIQQIDKNVDVAIEMQDGSIVLNQL